MEEMINRIYINHKTQNLYNVLETCINATNEQDGQVMVIYRRCKGRELFCREINEFNIKFIRT